MIAYIFLGASVGYLIGNLVLLAWVLISEKTTKTGEKQDPFKIIDIQAEVERNLKAQGIESSLEYLKRQQPRVFSAEDKGYPVLL